MAKPVTADAPPVAPALESQPPHRDFLPITGFLARKSSTTLFALAERMRTRQVRRASARRQVAGDDLHEVVHAHPRVVRGRARTSSAATPSSCRRATSSWVAASRSADTARVLSRYVERHHDPHVRPRRVEELARYANVPVINGLTDLLHPCQVLADLLTVRQHLGTYEGKTVAWIGDGNNMANSWINAACRLGFDLRIACPDGYDPADHLLAEAKKQAKITVTRDPMAAAEGAHVVTTDVWASMGQEEEQTKRAKAFAEYVVSAKLMAKADPHAIFLHCLPAHRGEEVAAEVIDGPQSRVWDEAENRLHVQKAVMAVLMGGESVG